MLCLTILSCCPTSGGNYSGSSSGGGFTPSNPTEPPGGFTFSVLEDSIQDSKVVFNFGFGPDITTVAIADNGNFQPATYINATTSIKWPITDGKTIYIKYCNKFGKCSRVLSQTVVLKKHPDSIPKQKTELFTRNLYRGMRGNDVIRLQQFLNSHGFPIAKTGIGSLGNENSFFGNLTKKALVKFQEKHSGAILKPLGLTKGTGYLGVSTRNFINHAN